MITTVEELILELKGQLDYLSHSTKIIGMEADDIRQELVIVILQDYAKFSNFTQYGIGWWFKRLKWALQNIIEKERRDPINRATRIDTIE